MIGVEPTTSRATTWHSNQLSYIHHLLARLKGLEPLTYCLEGSCSIQLSYKRIFTLERVMGIEPTRPAWKAGILPLNYTRRCLTTLIIIHNQRCNVNTFSRKNMIFFLFYSELKTILSSFTSAAIAQSSESALSMIIFAIPSSISLRIRFLRSLAPLCPPCDFFAR